MDGEVVWRDIPNLEPYQASNTGLIRNKNREKPLYQYQMGGYMNVQCGNRRFRSHRLIASAFLPNDNNHPDIDHIDGNKLNNNVSNLCWENHQVNVKKAMKDRVVNAQPLRFSNEYETLVFYSMNESARYFKKCIGTIYAVLQTSLARPAYRWNGYKIEKISEDAYNEAMVREMYESGDLYSIN